MDNIASGKRPDRSAHDWVDGDAIPAELAKWCIGCGAKVIMPCVACRAKESLAGIRRRPGAEQTNPDELNFQLRPDHQKRYDEIRQARRAAEDLAAEVANCSPETEGATLLMAAPASAAQIAPVVARQINTATFPADGLAPPMAPGSPASHRPIDPAGAASDATAATLTHSACVLHVDRGYGLNRGGAA